MKTFILTLFMSLTSLFAFGQSYDKLWKQVEQFEDDGKPKSAYDAASKILKKALRAHHTGQTLSARLKMASLRQEWAPDSFFTDIRELEALRSAERRPEARAVYASLLAELYEMNRDRSQASDLELASGDIREWTRQQYDSAAVDNWKLSMMDLPALAKAKSSDWLPFIEQDEQSEYFNHDLLHVLWHRVLEQEDDVWRNTGHAKELLAREVAEVYRQLGNREAELLVMLDYIEEQTAVSDSKLLLQLKEQFSDLPLCAEVYLRLIGCYYDVKQRIELARECISRYPDYYRIGEVRNNLNNLLKPVVEWYGSTYYYPGKTYEWRVYSSNAKRVTLELLRMPDTFRGVNLSGTNEERIQKIRQKGRVVSTNHLNTAVDQPWDNHRDTIAWTAPAPGSYALVITAESDEAEALAKRIEQYSCFVCTRLQPLNQNGLGKQRTIVVDAESGQPVQGAEVEFYYLVNNESRRHVATLTTDAEGRVALADSLVKINSTHLRRRVTKGDDTFMEEQENYFYLQGSGADEKESVKLHLYSDRSIYRPGQAVHIGGILYRQLHWDASVVAGCDVSLVLRDVNGKEVSKQIVTTDEMGKLSADFMLPQVGLPGRYSLSASFNAGTGPRYGDLTLRVEEYKRPTFEVTMDKAPDMQWPAKEITLTGKAVGYNGVPVREGRVTGTYRFTYPYWWWNSRRDSERMPIDTVSTDENGCFSIRVPLTSLSDEVLWGGLNLQLEVDVLSVAGETRQGSTSVPLCRKPLRLYVTMPEQQDRDRLKPVSLELLSSTGQPTDGTVEWAIYPANQRKRVSDEVVLQGVVKSNDRQLTFDTNTLRQLKGGQYEFYAKATSGEHSDSTRAYFLVFGMDDTQLPKVTPSWLYCPDATFNKERAARLQVGTSFDNVAFYYSIVAGDSVVKEALLQLSDEMRVIEVPYDKSYGDGAAFHYVFLKEGKVYKGTQILRLTMPERTLRWEWKTFRDHLHPGDTETWTLSLRTPDGKPASAQVMATLYDASLDALAPHAWELFVSRAYRITSLPWVNSEYFTSSTYQRLAFPMKSYKSLSMSYDDFDREWYGGLSFHSRYALLGAGRGMLLEDRMPMAVPMMAKQMRREEADNATDAVEVAEEESATQTTAQQQGEETVAAPQPAVRQNFNETAAFLPRLTTNAKGEVAITFTLPESLTTWKMLGIAHTKDMMSTTFNAETVARKEMMARLYLPRFLRADDHASIRATIQNMTDEALSGKALLEIFDPETDRVIVREQKTFTAQPNGECLLVYDYQPDDACPVVAVRLTAESQTFADGEQHYLPILPSKTYLTESVEIRADSLGTFTTDLSSLFNHDNPTATNRRLTIEYTAHPIWYALQALPSLVEPRYDDIISLGTALQAQSLATYIANTTPRLKTLVEIWQREQAQGQPALVSRLAQDEELKQLILDETPWLRDAENEADRKARLIELFNLSQQERTLVSIAQRMERRLQPDGGYSWFPGMESSEVMTRVVASELTRLRVMTNDCATLPFEVKQIVNRLLERNVDFIAKKTAEHVKELKEMEKKKVKISTASLMYLEYVYTTQHAGISLTARQKADVDYILDHMKGSVAGMDNWERAMAAIVMNTAGRKREARLYYESLLEHTTTTPDHGTFFDYAGGSFKPTSHKIIHHVAAMEAVHEMEPDNAALRKGLQRWLLQQKRTQMWESNICTADAIYALLICNSVELQSAAPDDITLNYASRQVNISRRDADEAVSGLGFIKKAFTDGEAPKSITVERHTDSEAWGAAFATFLTPMTDASASATGLKVRREVSTTTPKVGERFTTRYVISADRDYEYVCLRADRPACAEPAEQSSGYRWQGGLGYYRAVRDARTEYFFDFLPKGTYVLEETAFIDRAGRYTSGLTTLRCLYAPEYGSNTAAIELKVEK